MSEQAATPRIIALIGPTASGKSDLALELARRHGAHIMSCDSLLVYRHLDIGTAKPSAEELAAVPHHGIDLVEPDQAFTAGDYVRHARPILDRLVAEGTPVVIVGGTGFYLKALLLGVWDAPPTQPEIRKRLEDEVAALPGAERAKALHDKLVARDPDYAPKIAVNDTYRVIRALEIIESTGQTMRQVLESRSLQNPIPYPVPVLGINRNRAELEKRIRQRTDAMFAKGFVREVQELLQRYSAPPRSMLCVGYAEVLEFLEGRLTITECRERIVISTRQLAKKQMTFFKGMPIDVSWYELPKDEQTLLDLASKTLKPY